MPKRIILAISKGIILAASVIMAQDNNLSKYVYLVRIRTGNKIYIQTGFRKEGTKGIITALHGVALADSPISAMNSDRDVLINLRIVEVDIKNDLALLSSKELSERESDGIEPPDREISIGERLHALGYPLGINFHRQPLEVGYPAKENLINLIPLESRRVFLRRGSPSLEIEVVNIAGSLLAGHSGAPIVNPTNRLVGVGNGGLLKGAANISWAIPIANIHWKTVSDLTRGIIGTLKNLEVEDLFALKEELPDSCKCRYQAATPTAAIINLIHAEGEAAKRKDISIIQHIFAANAVIYDKTNGKGWNNPITRYEILFDNYTFMNAIHFDIQEVITAENVARYTSASRGRFFRNVDPENILIYETPPGSDEWEFGKNSCGCWVITNFTFR